MKKFLFGFSMVVILLAGYAVGLARKNNILEVLNNKVDKQKELLYNQNQLINELEYENKQLKFLYFKGCELCIKS